MWSSRAKEEYEKGRREAAIQRSASRRTAREAALLKRAKAMERSRRPFLHAQSLKRAVAGVKAEVHALMSRGGMTTGPPQQLHPVFFN